VYWCRTCESYLPDDTESNQIAKLIAHHHLNTYVQHKCSSACTVAFLAGKRRCISATAKIGFHAGRRLSVAPSISMMGLENIQRDEYAKAGLPVPGDREHHSLGTFAH
jgi:hypothetical protein